MALRGCLEDTSALVPGGARSVLGAPVPIYEWDFTKSVNPLTDIRSGLAATLTRASDGTYVDAGGIIQTASSNEARQTFDPSDGIPLGLLIEAARTNVVLHSADWSDAVWAPGSGETVTANVGTAPDGNTAADRVEVAGTSDEIQQNLTLTTGVPKVFSSFYKYVDNQWVQLRFQENFGGFERVNSPVDVLNRLAGTQFNNATAPPTPLNNGIELYPDSWLRHWSAVTPQAGTGFAHLTRPTANDTAETGVAGGKVDGWGHQVEDNARDATTYIATGASSVTRAADVCSVSVSLSEYTIVIKARTAKGRAVGSGIQVLFQSDDGGSNNRVRIIRNASREIHVITVVGGSGTADLNLGVVADDTDFSIAARIATNDVGAAIAGAAVTPDTSATVPSTTSGRIGMNHSSLSQWNGPISSVAVYEASLADERLEELAP